MTGKEKQRTMKGNTSDISYFCLSPKEEAAMKVLWGTQEALSASAIAEGIPNRTWPASSIQAILRGLEKKKAIRVDSVAKLGKSYGRLFRPALSANEYAAMQFGRFYQSGRQDCFAMLSSLLGNTGHGDEEIIEALHALIKEYEGKR